MSEIGKKWGRIRGDLVQRPPGHSAAYNLFKRYSEGAKKRSLTFEIGLDDFMRVTAQCCHYCGIAPHRSYGHGRRNGKWTYNGLDRVDNAHGYHVANVVACCRDCNTAKKNWTLAQFYDWVSRIHQRKGQVDARAS